MTNLRKPTVALCLIAGLLMMTGCGKSIPQYTADAADATQSYLDVSKVLYDNGKIGKPTYLKLLDVAEKANKDTDAFKATAVKLGTITSDNKKPLQDKIDDAIQLFKSVGDTQIGNSADKAKFDAIVNAVVIAYQGILAALANIKKPTPVTPKIVTEFDQYNHAIAKQIGYEKFRVDPKFVYELPETCDIGEWVIVLPKPSEARQTLTLLGCTEPAIEGELIWQTRSIQALP